jgi:hypothetical protein
MYTIKAGKIQTISRCFSSGEVFNGPNTTLLFYISSSCLRQDTMEELMFTQNGIFFKICTLISAQKNILSLENKKKEKYPFFFS